MGNGGSELDLDNLTNILVAAHGSLNRVKIWVKRLDIELLRIEGMINYEKNRLHPTNFRAHSGDGRGGRRSDLRLLKKE